MFQSQLGNSSDLRHLLSTLRFWGSEIIQYVVNNKPSEWDAAFEDFDSELIYLSFLRRLSRSADTTIKRSGRSKLYYAVLSMVWTEDVMTNCSKLCCLQFEHSFRATWDSETCKLAAQFGNLSMVQWFHKHGCPWDITTTTGACHVGRLDSLTYAHENGCPWGAETCASATVTEEITCLMYAHENGCPWDATTCERAAAAGSLCAL